MKNGQNIRDLWDTIKYTNIWIVGIPEEENVAERMFQEVMSRNSKFMKNINLHIQETQQI